MVLAYYVPGGAARADLIAHANQITAIAPLWYSISPAGTVRTLAADAATVTRIAERRGVEVFPLVINGYGNAGMLTRPNQASANIAALAHIAEQAGYQGYNLDFEGLGNADEAGLEAFAARLAAALHRIGKRLIVSVGPRTGAANAYHVYNYAVLGRIADYVDIMLYDDHDNTGPAGPVAPMAWVENVLRYARATIPRPKVLVGIADYGYNWAEDGSTEISASRAMPLARRYGATWVGGRTEEPEITYTDGAGYTHTVWFEDSYSDAPRIALARANGFGGIALWDLGEENSGFWPMLAKMLG